MFARSRFYTPKFELVAPKDWRGALAKLVRGCGLLDVQRETIQGVLIQSVLIDSGVRHYVEQPDQGDHVKRYVASMDLQISYSEAT